MTEDEVNQSVAGHQKLMAMIVSTASRGQGQEWKFIKFHMMTHITENIRLLRVPKNVDTSTAEHNHIENAKKPIKHTQQEADCVKEQTAERYYENLVLEFAQRSIYKKMEFKVSNTQDRQMSGSKFTIKVCSNENDSNEK